MANSFTRFTLAEGVNLYVQPTVKFKTNVIYVYIHLPLTPDTVTYNALLPMVLARGSQEYPTTAALSRHLDNLYGASFGVDVSRRGEVQSVVFRMEVPSDQHIPGESGLLARAMQTLGSVMLRPATQGDGLTPEFVAQEKENLRQLIDGLINDKRRYAMVRCTEAMCEGEPFALYRLGRVQDLEGITPQSLLAHHGEVLRSAPIDIFVIGDVAPEQIQTMVAKALPFPLPDLDGRVMPQTMVKQEPDRAIRDVVDRLDVNQGVLVIGLRTGTTVTDDDYFPMIVANGVLGAFPHSKLFQEVREKHSLAYFAFSGVETVKGIGYMYAGIEFEHFNKAKEIMIEQLKAVQEGDISDEVFETTIHALVNDMLSAADSPGAMADLAVDRVFSGRDMTIEDRVNAFRQVTKEQAAQAARKFSLDTIYFLNRLEGGQ